MGHYEESELHKLERSLAYESAVCLIESSCASLPELGTEWFDGGDVDHYCANAVKDACRYLDLRGLLECDPKNLNHIAIRDESEATA
jgi:hypothetical protein